MLAKVVIRTRYKQYRDPVIKTYLYGATSGQKLHMVPLHAVLNWLNYCSVVIRKIFVTSRDEWESLSSLMRHDWGQGPEQTQLLFYITLSSSITEYSMESKSRSLSWRFVWEKYTEKQLRMRSNNHYDWTVGGTLTDSMFISNKHFKIIP